MKKTQKDKQRPKVLVGALELQRKIGQVKNARGTFTPGGICSSSKPKRKPGPGLRWRVFERDNFRCVVCGDNPKHNPECVLQADHIIPYIEGGKTNLENLQTLCDYCNLGKGVEISPEDEGDEDSTDCWEDLEHRA